MSVLKAAFTGCLLLAVSPAVCAQEPYLDDRSSATAVVQSYYNAINKQQYSRAWSYRLRLGADTDWSAQYRAYEKFRDGFGPERPHITLLTGAVSDDAGAGSYRYGVPVAIEVIGHAGQRERFAGCFYLKLSSPTAQDDIPYQPLYIERTAMQRAKGALGKIMPAECDPG